MDKETSDFDEEDFDVDELLHEEVDNPIDEDTDEEAKVVAKKSKGRPKGTTKDKELIKEIPVEVAEVNKELSNMEWQPYAQPAYEGFQNIKTGELIDEKEAIRRVLCYAQEAARGSR